MTMDIIRPVQVTFLKLDMAPKKKQAGRLS